jgi:hypothetical protein
MLKHSISLVFATLMLSHLTFAAAVPTQDGFYQVGYAANLNIGDTEVNISNDGFRGGFFNNSINGGLGNLCVNVFAFDPSEEEVSCCSCLVTPNALVALSARNDLINNVLTPAIPSSIVIKLTATVPGTTMGSPISYTSCNPTHSETTGTGTTGDPTPYDLTAGLLAWGATLEPDGTPGTYKPVSVRFLNSTLNTTATTGELASLTSVCNFIQQEGSGFGVCKSCTLGALNGSKH